MADGSDIIIRGGSCEIEFDHETFKQDQNNSKKHKHETFKIKRIVITGDKTFSADTPNGFKGEIRITVE